MSIERFDDDFEFLCDFPNCSADNGPHFNWDEGLNDMKIDGWRCSFLNGEWYHFCEKH